MLLRRALPMLALALPFAACGARSNLICDAPVTATPIIPNIYFVLDHSKSMLEEGKWDSVRSALEGVITTIGNQAGFGAAVFPNPTTGGCDVGLEVMSVRPGSAATADALAAATQATPAGGTPTAATLSSLLPTLKALVGHTFVILATDGGPNCNAALTCDVNRCTSNIDNVATGCVPGVLPNCCDGAGAGQGCLDDTGTVDAVSTLRNAGIPTFVIGVPGSEGYAAVLDSAAEAGGTARSAPPFYYAVTSSDAAALTTALSQVIEQVAASCFLKLSRTVVPSDLVVQLGGVDIVHNGANGFSIEGTLNAPLLALHGTACDRAVAGATLAMHVVEECPTK